MERRIRGGLAVLLVGLLGASAPLALVPSAQAQGGGSGSQRCGGSAITVHAPAPGQTVVTPSDVGLPAKAAALTAGASRVHARWLTSVECRVLATRHGIKPVGRPRQGRSMTSMATTAATQYSYNWSGYFATTTQTPASVTGSWTEPSVSLPTGSSEAHSAVWVGLGGMSPNGELVQDGTGQDISARYGSDHFFWYELYPMEYAVEIATTGPGSLPIAAGDQVRATSSWSASTGQASFGVCNDTQAVCLSFSQASPAPANTAEWIVEAPEVNGCQATPPVFSPVSFTNASFDAPTTQAAAQGNAEAIDMVSNSTSASYLAVPGPVNGGAFTVSYQGPAPASRPSAPLGLHLGNGVAGGALTTVATWSCPSVATPNVTSYQVRIQARSPHGVYSPYRYATVSGATTRLNIAGTRGYLYRVQVAARNSVGWSPWTSWSNPAYPR